MVDSLKQKKPGDEKENCFFSILILIVGSSGQAKEKQTFIIQEVDSASYFAFKENACVQEMVLDKVTDLEAVKERLKGRVIWGEYEYETQKMKETEEGETVYRIVFDNGKTVVYDYPDVGFVAYYPEADILFLEGGHSSSLIFNLTTGEETNEVGDPSYWCDSPSGRYKFNGYYNGQVEVYFIQEKSETKYETIIELDCSPESALARHIGFVPEFLSGVGWQNDSTLNFRVSRYNYPEDKSRNFYYQLILE